MMSGWNNSDKSLYYCKTVFFLAESIQALKAIVFLANCFNQIFNDSGPYQNLIHLEGIWSVSIFFPYSSISDVSKSEPFVTFNNLVKESLIILYVS